LGRHRLFHRVVALGQTRQESHGYSPGYAGTAGDLAMTVRVHNFDTQAFEDRFREYDSDIQDAMRLLASGRGDAQAICKQILRFSLWNAGILLILGRDDAEALRYLRQALEYGLRSLEAPASMGAPRVYDVQLEKSEEGSRVLAMHEIPPSSRPPGLLSIGDFDSVLSLAVCFGDRVQIEAAARYREERYRNPNVVAGEHFYTYLRAWKRYLLGDEVGGKREMKAAIEANPNAVTKVHMEAFVSLLEGNQDGFARHIEERLEGHRKQYEKKPHSAEGIICLPVTMLCRVAIDRGIAMKERPYVPVRLLPNYKPTAH